MTDKRDPTYANPRAKIAYLAHPKTASQATVAALRGVGFPALQSRHHHGRLAQPMGEDWIVCTTVRNHFDLFVSWYYHKKRDLVESFTVKFMEELIGPIDRTNHYFPDTHRLYSYHGGVATHVMKFEALEDGLNTVLALRGLGPVTLARENVSERRKNRPYQEFHDPSTRSWVEDRYGEEMEELGYQWER